MLSGKKKKSRISPEPILEDGKTSIPTANESAYLGDNELQETITIQARAIREMTTSLERASNLMEKQSATFTNEIDVLKQAKNKLEKKIQTLESQVISKQEVSIQESPPQLLPTSVSNKNPTVPDAVEAAEFMSELDEMISNLQKVGATKSLPTIVKHLLTLFRYVFPAQLVEMVVLDPYSKGVFWSMKCRTEHIGENSSVFFSDDSGDKIEMELLAEVVRTCQSVVIKDNVFYPGNGETNIGSKTKKSKKRQSFMSSTTKSNPTITKYLSKLNTSIVDTWKKAQSDQINTPVQSGVIVPVVDHGNGSVLAIFSIVNRMNPIAGSIINFSNQDLELLKLFLNRCNDVFRQTRTLTGLLSAARRRHGTLNARMFRVRNTSSSLTTHQEEGYTTTDGDTKGDYDRIGTTLEQQMSQTKTWLKDQLLHREYKMIFQPNPRVQKKLRIFVITLKALSKFLKTLARLRAENRKSFHITRKASILTDLNTYNVMSFNFDEFSVSAEKLEEHAFNILDMTGMIKQWHTPPDRLKLFIKRVRDSYLDNPYHCWAHGFMVMRMTCILVRDCPFLELTTYELGSICIAAMCHDIAHPGKNNAFESKVNSALAIRYNDKSIYENMHAATTFEILSDPACDIFATLTKDKRGQLRKMMIQSILMTDMASHFLLAKKLESKVTDAVTFSKEDPEDKQLLLDLIVHSSDIGAQALPVPIANKWSEGVLIEFQQVHEAEKAAGVDLTPFIIGLDEPLRAANCQFGFINFIVKPLWSNLVKVVPNSASELMENLDGNVKYWKDKVTEHTPAPEPETETETKVVDETKTEKEESKVDTPPLAVTDETKDDNSSGDTLTTTTVVKE